MLLTVVILTLNEELHIKRAIESVSEVADRIFVIDSGSTDDTVSIAVSCGANVLSNPFVTQAKQFNWALENLPDDTQWVFRLDADEVMTIDLKRSLIGVLSEVRDGINGISVDRRILFLGRSIRWGGVFPVTLVRAFRFGYGRSEDRWMDEHIIVDGGVIRSSGELLDWNLKPLTWWVEKHNRYASREAIEVLNTEYHFLSRGAETNLSGGSEFRRFVKARIYTRMPLGLRSFIYFAYRYIVRLGFLDGYRGFAFHFLQGFWYRFLVDLKTREVKQRLGNDGGNIFDIIYEVLDINLSSEPEAATTQSSNQES